MRLFQNSGLYASYRPRLAELSKGCRSFADHIRVFLEDRYGAPHFLMPVLTGDASAAFTNADHAEVQTLWAREQGLPSGTSESDILLAQIEHHRTEVFYNLDPMRFGSSFVRRLPGSVKCAIAWRAAPSPGADFGAYHRIVCNFPSILRSYELAGWRAAYFAPAYDPEMNSYAASEDRPIDVMFVGCYSRHHRRRAAILEAVAERRKDWRIVMHLDRSRLTRWAESKAGQWWPPLAKHRRPVGIQEVTSDPVFGRDLYAAISRAKIVLNGAVDMAGDDRGNMRCFESMGCGALMVSDEGRYPERMNAGSTFLSYRDADQAVQLIDQMLTHREQLHAMAARGHEVVRDHYSKARQWLAFQTIAGTV